MQGPRAGQVGEAAVPDDEAVSSSDSEADLDGASSGPEDSDDEQRCVAAVVSLAKLHNSNVLGSRNHG